MKRHQADRLAQLRIRPRLAEHLVIKGALIKRLMLRFDIRGMLHGDRAPQACRGAARVQGRADQAVACALWQSEFAPPAAELHRGWDKACCHYSLQSSGLCPNPSNGTSKRESRMVIEVVSLPKSPQSSPGFASMVYAPLIDRLLAAFRVLRSRCKRELKH
jgi:hypothetical protein